MRLLIDEPCTETEGVSILFDFEAIAETISQAILDSAPNFNVGIYGPWGSGKTSLLRLIKRNISEAASSGQDGRSGLNILPVDFSAWEFQDLEYPLQALARVIVGAVETQATADSESGRGQTPWLKLSGDTLKRKLARLVKDHIPQQFGISVLGNGIEFGTQEKGSEAFETVCSRLLHLPTGTIIVVYVDDLDRCPPDFQVRFLDCIKTFFDLPGYVFVLALDHERVLGALTRSTLHHLGDISEAGSYLDKMIHIAWHLRPPSVDERVTFLEESIKLLNLYNSEEIIRLEENKEELIEVARLEDNPRRLKALLNGFALRWRDQRAVRFGCYVTYTQLQKCDPRFLALVEAAAILHSVDFFPDLRNYLRASKAYPPVAEEDHHKARRDLQELLGAPLLEDIDKCKTSQVVRIIAGETGRRLFTSPMWRAIVRGQGLPALKREPEKVLKFYQFGNYMTYLPLHYACLKGMLPGYLVEFAPPLFNDQNVYLIVSRGSDDDEGELVFGLSDPLDLCTPQMDCIVLSPIVTQVALWAVAAKGAGAPAEESLGAATIATYKRDSTCYRLLHHYREGRAPEATYDPAKARKQIDSGKTQIVVMQEPDATSAMLDGVAEPDALWLAKVFPNYPFAAVYARRELLNRPVGRRAIGAVVRALRRSLQELREASQALNSDLGREVVSFICSEYGLEEAVARKAFGRLGACFASEADEDTFTANLQSWYDILVKVQGLPGGVNVAQLYPRSSIEGIGDEL